MKKRLYSIGLSLVILALLFSAIGCEGPVGPQGAQGLEGVQGAAGATGSQGLQGAKGDVGEPGTPIIWMGTATSAPKSWRVLNYAYYNSTHRTSYIWDGNSWEILARDGAAGATGAAGPRGSTWEILAKDGATGYPGATGASGPRGYAGATGLQGPAGPMGPRGPQGIQGEQGPQGETGATGATGPQGATGAIGPAGSVGVTGATGAIGPQGDTGAIGPIGLQGEQGPIGPPGPQGEQGEPGAEYTLPYTIQMGTCTFHLDGATFTGGYHKMKYQVTFISSFKSIPLVFVTATSGTIINSVYTLWDVAAIGTTVDGFELRIGSDMPQATATVTFNWLAISQ